MWSNPLAWISNASTPPPHWKKKKKLFFLWFVIQRRSLAGEHFSFFFLLSFSPIPVKNCMKKWYRWRGVSKTGIFLCSISVCATGHRKRLLIYIYIFSSPNPSFSPHSFVCLFQFLDTLQRCWSSFLGLRLAHHKQQLIEAAELCCANCSLLIMQGHRGQGGWSQCLSGAVVHVAPFSLMMKREMGWGLHYRERRIRSQVLCARTRSGWDEEGDSLQRAWNYWQPASFPPLPLKHPGVRMQPLMTQ